ncbi:ABC transporter substrate-binding protein [Pyruvatibacter sp.]
MGRLGIIGAGIAAVVLIALGMWLTEPQSLSDDGGTQRITFATDWKAQAEHGGFYQAVAKGFYAKRGLEVEILPGGPGVNVPQLMAGGAVDFGMGSNSFIPLRIVEAGIPVRAVMTVFQKDPQVLITHPRDDVTSLADMKGKPIMISDATISAFWVWLKAKYDFSDDQIRKYTYNLAPFLVDETAIQQGYVTSEPYTIEKEGGVAPEVYLLADNGYPGYATMVLAPNAWIEESPEVIQAFVDGTIEGWYDYLYGDPEPANALILQDNPEITADVLAQAREKMLSYELATGGDAKTLGLGAMTEDRWRTFFEVMSANGVYEADLDWKAAFTSEFVNKGPMDMPGLPAAHGN